MLEIFEEGESFSALGCTCACGCGCACTCLLGMPQAMPDAYLYDKKGNEGKMDQFRDIAG